LKIVVRLAATGIAALALTAQGAVMTPANDPFAAIGAQWTVESSAALSVNADSNSPAITKAENFTPEPATLGLIGAGLTTLGLLRRRRTRKH
jgi:hypothetical protein